MLATIESIPKRIDEKLRRMERDLPEPDPDFFAGMRLRPSSLDEQQLADIESALGRTVPAEFREIASTYDLAGLELGGVVFGDESEFAEFLRNQIAEPEATWGPSGRPPDLLLLGGSDGYLVLLDCSTGEVSAHLRDAPPAERRVVAADFGIFFRALATLFLEEDITDADVLASQVATAAGSDPGGTFWLDRARGLA
jgi:hypothetical protein